MALYTSGVSSSVWERKKKDIPASSTVAVDDVELTRFSGLRYVICVINGNETIMFDMSLIKKISSVKETIYGKIGSGISFAVNTSVLSGIMYLNITNNEAVDIAVDLIKCKFN
jgi:hypothetical protein